MLVVPLKSLRSAIESLPVNPPPAATFPVRVSIPWLLDARVEPGRPTPVVPRDEIEFEKHAEPEGTAVRAVWQWEGFVDVGEIERRQAGGEAALVGSIRAQLGPRCSRVVVLGAEEHQSRIRVHVAPGVDLREPLSNRVVQHDGATPCVPAEDFDRDVGHVYQVTRTDHELTYSLSPGGPPAGRLPIGSLACAPRGAPILLGGGSTDAGVPIWIYFEVL